MRMVSFVISSTMESFCLSSQFLTFVESIMCYPLPPLVIINTIILARYLAYSREV